MNTMVRQAVEPRGGELIQADSASLMEVISRAASDPNADADKMERLLGMYERITARQAEAAYNQALAAMQPKLPVVTERGAIKNNAGAVQSTYARWEDINDAVRPILAEHGFALSFKVGNEGDKITVTGILSHLGGHAERTTFALPVDMSGSKNGVQGLGSSTSYGKRYTAMALLNITTRGEDDDGQYGGARQQSAAVSAGISAINLCADAAELKTWKDKNAAMLADLPPDEADAIVRVWNTRARKLKEAGRS